jgi:hypothetical protein
MLGFRLEDGESEHAALPLKVLALMLTWSKKLGSHSWILF